MALLPHLELGLARREERQHARGVPHDEVRIGVHEALELERIARDPARGVIGDRHQAHLRAVLVRERVLADVELQLADRAEDRRAAVERMEDLDRALLAELLEPGAQLLRLHRGRELDAAEYFGGEKRQAAELQRLALGERVAETDGAA